jgi:hypothetical protein
MSVGNLHTFSLAPPIVNDNLKYVLFYCGVSFDDNLTNNALFLIFRYELKTLCTTLIRMALGRTT